MSVPAVLIWATSYSAFRNARATRLCFAIGGQIILTVALEPMVLLSVPISLLGTIPIIMLMDWAYMR
jgi:hypothetical protein